MEVNEPDGFDHFEALSDAVAIGSSEVALTFPWNVLEPTAGNYDLGFLELGLGLYADAGVSVMLSIPTIDTVQKMLPADLMPTPMDDAEVLARFAALLDAVFAVSGAELTHLVIGNEVDVYLGGRPQAEWDAFKVFVDGGVAHAHGVRPDVDVGISVTFGALPSPRASALTASTDVRYATYYFIGNDFGGTPATHVGDDVLTLLTYADDQPLVLKEFGYPTAAVTGGSEAGQAEFIDELFAAWDRNADRIPFVMFSVMFDNAYQDCALTAASYGFAGDEEFIQFLCTLGLRTLDGAPKPAWEHLAANATARGF